MQPIASYTEVMLSYHYIYKKIIWKFLIHQNHFRYFALSRACMILRLWLTSELYIVLGKTLFPPIFMPLNASQESTNERGSQSHHLDPTGYREWTSQTVDFKRMQFNKLYAASVSYCFFKAPVDLARFITGPFDGDSSWIFIRCTSAPCNALQFIKNSAILHEESCFNGFRIV